MDLETFRAVIGAGIGVATIIAIIATLVFAFCVWTDVNSTLR
jgi:hypothetical protein